MRAVSTARRLQFPTLLARTEASNVEKLVTRFLSTSARPEQIGVITP